MGTDSDFFPHTGGGRRASCRRMRMLLYADLTRVVAVLFLARLATGCNSSTGSACESAGGTCIVGPGANCARQGSANAQDCNTSPPNPGGGVCCLEFQDAGSVAED